MSRSKQVIFFSMIFVCTAVSVFAQHATPREVVASFYRFDGKSSQVFNRRNIEARRKWMEFSLYELLTKELARERDFLKANPDEKPHFGDGLPFRPTEETCEAGGKSYKRTTSVGEAIIQGQTATVPVTFAYPAECKVPPIVYKIKLIEVKVDWLIVDIEYPDGSTLVQDLKRSAY